MAFERLTLKSALCFGWSPPSATGPAGCWYDIAEQSVTKGWRGVDVGALEKDLAANVDASYFYICQGEFQDFDTDFRWRAVFVNDHAMWRLDMPGQDIDIIPEDAKEFFGSEYFKKFSKRCGDLIDRAKARYWKTVDPRLKAGDLLQVAPEKLERILHDVDVKHFMENLRNGKYELV